MATIAPTVTAYNPHQFREQMERLQPFTSRVHIDFMDGDFVAPTSPDLNQTWWPYSMTADLHLMYRRPMEYLREIIRLRPALVIVQAEADVHHMHFAAELHKEDVKVGLCVLQDTPIENVEQIMHSFDHVLVFSGHLGHHGGEADMGLLDKVQRIKEHHPEVEVGWDGGINNQNARALIDAGVDVLNVGGFIHKAEDPSDAYAKLIEIVKSTHEAKTDT